MFKAHRLSKHLPLGSRVINWKKRIRSASARAPSIAQQITPDECLPKEQLLSRNVERFRGGLFFKAVRLLFHSTLGLRVIKKKKKCRPPSIAQQITPDECLPEDQLVSRNVERFRGGLVFMAHRLLYHSTLGLRVTKKKTRKCLPPSIAQQITPDKCLPSVHD